MNQLTISGVLVAIEPIRYTPTGYEVFQGKFHHRSETLQAGHVRRLEFDFEALAYDVPAQTLNQLSLGTAIEIKGFICTRSMRTNRLVVHITDYLLKE